MARTAGLGILIIVLAFAASVIAWETLGPVAGGLCVVGGVVLIGVTGFTWASLDN